MITENLCENWSQKSDSMLYLIWSGQYWRKNIKLFKCCTVLLGTCVFDHSPDNTLFCSLKFVERHILFSKIKQDYYTVNTTANNVFESLFGKIVFMSEEVRNSKLSLFFWLVKLEACQWENIPDTVDAQVLTVNLLRYLLHFSLTIKTACCKLHVQNTIVLYNYNRIY